MLSRLKCPSCKSHYPLWRVVLRFSTFRCPVCKTELVFTTESSWRIGTINGFICVAALIASIGAIGTEIIRMWQFWALLLTFAYVCGCAVGVVVGELAPLGPGARKPEQWGLLTRAAGRERVFLMLQLTLVIPLCIFLFFFVERLPSWLTFVVATVVLIVGVPGVIATARLFSKECQRGRTPKGKKRHRIAPK
jgi:hypothetical protein